MTTLKKKNILCCFFFQYNVTYLLDQKKSFNFPKIFSKFNYYYAIFFSYI